MNGMLHFMRHTALRLWVSLPIAGGVTLWGLSRFSLPAGSHAAALITAAALAAAFVAVGWAGGRLVVSRVRGLVRRASIAERQGLYLEAEECLKGALDLLDTFLASPAARRDNQPALAARLARFYLARTGLGAEAEDFIAGYIGRHPRDEEVAEQWIQHIEARGGLREEHQDLAARLGAAHPRHAVIQYSLARLYLMLERSDYLALRSYRSVCESDLRLPPEFTADLARLLRAGGQAAPWALEAYQRSGLPLPALDGSDAGRPSPGGTGETVPEPSGPAVPPDNDEGFRIGIGPDDPEAEEEEGRPSLLTRQRPAPVAVAVISRLAEFVASAARSASAALASAWAGGQRLWGSAAARRTLAGGVLAILAAGLLWVAATTLGRWVRTPAAPPVAEAPPSPPSVVSDPFTLQVAAYLKAEYALKLVEELKGKGLDAYWTETASGGKRWYQVRISRFPDSQTARDVGRDLKTRGVIDDFYVTNYSK